MNSANEYAMTALLVCFGAVLAGFAAILFAVAWKVTFGCYSLT